MEAGDLSSVLGLASAATLELLKDLIEDPELTLGLKPLKAVGQGLLLFFEFPDHLI